MKRKIGTDATSFVLFTVAWLASCMFAGTVEAQSSMLEGTFKLQHETHWGQAVLPAGDYRLSITTTGSPAMAVVHDLKTGKQVAIVAFQSRDSGATGETALLVDNRGTQQVIHSFRVAELGVVFISDPALAHGRGLQKEAGKTQMVPVVMAKK